jgi:hypothetical protein
MLRWDRNGFRKKCTGTRYTEFEFLHLVGSTSDVVHSSAFRACNVNKLFFMLGSNRTDLTKSAPGHVTLNLCFCIWWDLRVTWFIPVSPGRETSTHYFSCSGGTGTNFTKKLVGTHYAKLVFLHPLGSAGHVAYSGVSGP